jgi:phage gpG-like protein
VAVRAAIAPRCARQAAERERASSGKPASNCPSGLSWGSPIWASRPPRTPPSRNRDGGVLALGDRLRDTLRSRVSKAPTALVGACVRAAKSHANSRIRPREIALWMRPPLLAFRGLQRPAWLSCRTPLPWGGTASAPACSNVLLLLVLLGSCPGFWPFSGPFLRDVLRGVAALGTPLVAPARVPLPDRRRFGPARPQQCSRVPTLSRRRQHRTGSSRPHDEPRTPSLSARFEGRRCPFRCPDC